MTNTPKDPKHPTEIYNGIKWWTPLSKITNMPKRQRRWEKWRKWKDKQEKEGNED